MNMERYEMLDLDGSVIYSIIVTHKRHRLVHGRTHEDGSASPDHKYVQVSDNGYAWYTVYDNRFHRLVNA